MAALPYIQLYIADYLADTAHLTTEQHGAYLLLIFNYWQTGKPLRVDRLAAISRLNERWTSVEQALNDFFNERDGTWVHERIENDLKRVQLLQKQRSNAGKSSAKSRTKNKRSTSVERESNKRSTNKDTDTDTYTDTDKSKRKSNARGARLPQDWRPTIEQIEWATNERPDLDVRTEAAKFADYWHAKPGRDACKLDWDATWRNWVRNSKANGVNHVNKKPTSAVSRVEENIRKRRAASGLAGIRGDENGQPLRPPLD